MKNLRILLLALPLLTTGCSNDEETADGRDAQALKIAVDIQATTRNITPYMGTSFASGAKLGVRVVDGAGTTSDYDFQNACYTAGIVEGQQAWATDQEIIITEKYAKTMAYYPWTQGVDAAAIAVDCSTETDWMYCTWRPQFNYTQPTVSFQMTHAQSVIKVVYQNAPSPDTYTGDLTLKKLTVSGDCLARTGTLDGTTGTLSNQSGNSYVITYSNNEKLGTFTTQQDYVLTTGTSGTITFTIEIGTSKYTATTAALTLTQGKIYQYTLTITDTKLIIDPVTIIPWSSAEAVTIEGEEVES
jgi:hypothetical protein